MSEPLTHSDLIYLFVDGEASAAERSKLYDALANNPDLQMEFEDAMRLKAAVEREVTAAVPPPSLTESLFVRAGVALPAATSAIAPAVPAISNLANSGWFALAKTFALPALVVGSAVTYGVVKMTENNIVPPQPAAITRTVENHPSLPPMLGRTEMNGVTLAEGELVKNQSSNTKENRKSVSSIATTITPVAKADQPAVVVNQNNSSTTIPTQVALEEEVSIASIPSASINEASSIRISDIHGTGDMMNLNPLDMSTHQRYTGSFSLGYERYVGNTYFQDRDGKIPTTGFALNNSAIIAMLRIDEHSAGVLMFGEESFPFYLKTSDDGFSAQPSLTWFGVGYRYTIAEIETPAGIISPSVRGIIGGSQAGAIGKIKLGLDWNMFESPVSISGGYELTGVRYQTSTNSALAEKGAITLGLNYSF